MIKQRLFLFLYLFITTIALAAPPTNIPKQTLMVGKIEWQQCKKTPLGERLLQIYFKEYADIKKALNTGIGLDIDKIESVWLIGDNFDNCILVLNGSFSPEQVKAKIDPNTTIEQLEIKQADLAFYMPEESGKNENIVAILDSKTIVFGNPNRVKNYLNCQNKRKSQLSKKNKKRLAREFKKAPHFKVFFLAYPWHIDPGTQLLLNHLKSGEFTLSLGNDLDCMILLKAKSTKVTKAIKEVAHGALMTGLAKPGQSMPEELLKSDIAKYLKTKTKKKNIIISSKIKQQTIMKIVQESIMKNNSGNQK